MPIHPLDDEFDPLPDRTVLRRRRAFRRVTVLLVTLAVVAVTVIVLTSILPVHDDPEPRTVGLSTPVSAVSATSGFRSAADLTALAKEAAPGLRYSSVPLSADNDDAIYGVLTGWPRTPEGAVSAAMNYMAAWWTPAALNDETRHRLNRRLYTAEGLKTGPMSDERLSSLRRDLNLDREGEVLTPDGYISTTKILVSVAMPHYGAFRFIAINDNQSEAKIEAWMPVALGAATNENDTAGVRLWWAQSTMSMRWVEGDWRIHHIEFTQPGQTPQPRYPQYSNQSFAARAATLGPGWLLPADATENAYPGAVMTR